MRKTILIAIAAALLLTAVLCTAGCVNQTSSDPVVGAWYTKDGRSTGGICLMFSENHSGIYIYDTGAYDTEEGIPGISTNSVTLVWTAEGNNAYSVVFEEGSTARFTLNPDGKTFTTWNDILYTKVMDETGAISNSEMLLE